MELFYGVRGTGTIERAGLGWMEAGEPVTARVQPRQVAPAGLGREASFGPLWMLVRHDGACRLTLIPIVDGVARTDLTETYDFAAVAAVRDEIVKLTLSDPLTWPGEVTAFSRQALRGVWFTVRAELTPLEVGVDPPEGEVFAMGGLELESVPVGVSGPSIPVP